MTFSARWRGGGDPLRQLQLHLSGMPKYVQERASKAARAMVERRIDNQFINGFDPYGNRWPNPKDGHRPSMIRTGDLRRGYRVRVVKTGSGAGFSVRIENAMDYAKYLQKGTARMAPRKTVPDKAMPWAWKADFDKIAAEALRAWHDSLRF